MAQTSETIDRVEREMITAAFCLIREAVRDGRLAPGDVTREAAYAVGEHPDRAREAFNATAMRFAVGPPVG
jgi:hypothetical protein